jgi:hypothetical protein
MERDLNSADGAERQVSPLQTRWRSDRFIERIGIKRDPGDAQPFICS